MSRLTLGLGPDWSRLTAAEHALVEQIVDRSFRTRTVHRNGLSTYEARVALMMDLEAAHLAVGLDLEAMLEAKLFDFAHDVAGIVRHMDRVTGTLGGCFSPRCRRRGRAS